MISIRNERYNITINLMEITGMMINKYEKFYANKLDYFDEVDIFLKQHRSPKLMQGKIENIDSSIATKGITFVIKIFSQRKLQAQITSLMNYFKYLKKHSPNTFYEAKIKAAVIFLFCIFSSDSPFYFCVLFLSLEIDV